MVIDQFGEDIFQNKITSGYTYIKTIIEDEINTPYLWFKFEVEEDE